MSTEEKTELSCGRDVPWYPLRKQWQSSRLFSQDVGLLPFLEPWDPRWMDVERFQRSLAAAYWPGYTPTPLFVPYISAPQKQHPEQEMRKGPYKWRVSLDVAHFSPSEISLSVSEGFLQVGGKHEERPDEHGFIARCFTRKYRLPAEVDVTRIASTLSVDGILTVEAPVPQSSVPGAIIIPIKVEVEEDGEKKEKGGAPDTDPDSCRSPEDPDSTCAAGEEPDVGSESLQDSESQKSPDKDTSQQQEDKEADVTEEKQVMAGTGEAEEQEPGNQAPLSQEPEAPEIKQEHTQ